MPVMRPIWVEFNEPRCALSVHPFCSYQYSASNRFASVSDHYMLGHALLVRPVTSANTRDCMVMFPGDGDMIWYDIVTHIAIHGAQTLSVAAPIDKVLHPTTCSPL